MNTDAPYYEKEKKKLRDEMDQKLNGLTLHSGLQLLVDEIVSLKIEVHYLTLGLSNVRRPKPF